MNITNLQYQTVNGQLEIGILSQFLIHWILNLISCPHCCFCSLRNPNSNVWRFKVQGDGSMESRDQFLSQLNPLGCGSHPEIFWVRRQNHRSSLHLGLYPRDPDKFLLILPWNPVGPQWNRPKQQRTPSTPTSTSSSTIIIPWVPASTSIITININWVRAVRGYIATAIGSRNGACRCRKVNCCAEFDF